MSTISNMVPIASISVKSDEVTVARMFAARWEREDVPARPGVALIHTPNDV
jgi:hypothetical protein